MLLAIDQGNSRTKCGLFEGATLLRTWTFPTQKAATAADLVAALGPVVPGATLGLCTVVPALLPAWRVAADTLRLTLVHLTGETPTPLRNAYVSPQTLGPDRLMAAVAAAHQVGMPVIPISLGTATVVDAVADGAYLGGMIAPGVGLDLAALSTASSLPPSEWHVPEDAIGRSTADALASGLFHHSVGAVRAMIDAIRRALGTDAPLALTGGWAPTLAPHLGPVALLDEWLVLRGIARILSPSRP